mmetsp:Transcript_165754/g.532226  ORF Transcript_165754/g.532226 Transcript_165754/m.532226 type:complete len:214 (-) Transcript_165754:161-802(-)
MLQLRPSKRCLQVRHAVIPAEVVVNEPPLLRVEAQIPELATLLGKHRVIDQDHASLATGDVLVRVEAHGADVAQGAAGPPHAGLPDHLSCILDHLDALLLGQFQDGPHVDWKMVCVHAQDGLRAGRDLGGHLVHTHVEVVTAIYQNRNGAASHDLRDAGDDAKGGQDDLVALAEAQRLHRDVQGGGAVRDGDGVLPRAALGHGFLELLDLRAL